jgi:hypothetical protein
LEPSSNSLSGSLVERLSGKSVELGLAPPKERGFLVAGGCKCLVPGWCLSQQVGAPVFPHGAGVWQGLMGGGSLRDRGLVISLLAGAQQGLKGGRLRRGQGGYPGELWDWLCAGVWCRRMAGILVVVDPAAWPRGGYPSVVWVQGLEASAAEGQVSRWCVDPAQHERQGFCRAWVWCRAVA